MWSPVLPATSPAGAAPLSPPARTKHSATLHVHHVYVIGGRSGNIPLKDMWRYSLLDGRWEQMRPNGECPPALQEHTAVAHANNIYVFGGELGYSSTETPLWIYDTEANTWRKVRSQSNTGLLRSNGGIPRISSATTPKGRRGHTALVHKDFMLIYGGYQDLKGSSNELWAFYFETESWHLISSSVATGGGMPPARHKHSAVLHDGCMWVYGGMQDLNEKSDCWKFDTGSSQWYQSRNKLGPGVLHSHAACRLPSAMLVFGGEAGGQPNNELWRFHFGTEIWERLHVSGIKPQPRSESVALAISELHLSGSVTTTPIHSQPRVRLQQCFSADRTNRHSLHLSNNRVSPCEKMYSCKASNRSYVDGNNSNSNANQIMTGNFLREISKLSQINISRLGHNKCSYSILISNNDSTESLLNTNDNGTPHRHEPEQVVSPTVKVKNSMVKSQSAHTINKRRSANMEEALSPNVERDLKLPNRLNTMSEEVRRCEMTREPISVPNFSDLTLPTPVLSPVEAAKLVYLDSEEEDMYINEPFELPHDVLLVEPCTESSNASYRRIGDTKFNSVSSTEHHTYENVRPLSAFPKSASVRFQNFDLEEVSDENISTSDYASIEGVNKLSSASTYSVSTPGEDKHKKPNVNFANALDDEVPLSFCNPNYMGPDIQTILSNNRQHIWQTSSDTSRKQIAKLLNTPDSGVITTTDDMVEMKEMESIKPQRGRMPPRSLTIESPCSPRSFKENPVKFRAKSASRVENDKQRLKCDDDDVDTSSFTSDIVVPLYVYIFGGKEQSQVAVFRRPLSVWKFQFF